MLKNILFILICFALTGCFEILEEVSLNDNGSGTFKLTLNLSQSKTKLKSIMLMEKINGHKVPSKAEVKQEIEQACKIAKTVDGVTNVSNTIDFENYIFTLSCDFKNVTSLNKLVYELRKTKEKTKTPFEKHYEYNAATKEFNRNFTFLWENEFNKLKQEDKDVFDGANYITIYRFKNEVNATSNGEAKISPNKKNVMLQVKISDIITKKSTIKNQLKLK